MKRTAAYILTLTILLSIFLPAVSGASKPPYFGIDVSHHQQTIDWDKVATQIDFAILRCGYGEDLTSQDDRQWANNVAACERLGIPYGVYLYSYATTEEAALSEAKHVLRLLKGHKPALPIYFDIEDPKTTATLPDTELLKLCKVFCNEISAHGYEVGIYSSYYWWINKLTAPEYDQWDRWVARWGVTSAGLKKPYSMWQNSDNGSIDGISGAVDTDYWYKDLPAKCDHTYTFTTEKEAGCTTGGVLRYTCTLCGDVYRRETQPAGHEFDGGKITELPTCSLPGVKTYTCKRCGETRREQIPPTGGCPEPEPTFADVPGDAYYAEAVDWAVEQGITNGMGDGLFAPELPCTRGQVVTFLWRSQGSPVPNHTKAPFADVKPGDYWYDAVLWAVETGITKGTSEITFSPDLPCTRGQVVTFLYRSQGEPSISMANPFQDVLPGAYYEKAVVWANFFGITQGMSKSVFAPEQTCTRCQIVTFIYRNHEK